VVTFMIKPRSLSGSEPEAFARIMKGPNKSNCRVTAYRNLSATERIFMTKEYSGDH